MKNKAVRLSAVATCAFMVALTALAFLAPWLIRKYADFRAIPDSGFHAIVVAFYACFVPAFTALICLWRLLANIKRGQPFLQINANLMAVVSWCCAAVAVFTLATALWYLPLLFVTGSMAFIFLIVRVVRNCFLAAIQLREENELTI